MPDKHSIDELVMQGMAGATSFSPEETARLMRLLDKSDSLIAKHRECIDLAQLLRAQALVALGGGDIVVGQRVVSAWHNRARQPHWTLEDPPIAK